MKSISSTSLLVIKKNNTTSIQAVYKQIKYIYNYKNFSVICSTKKISDLIQSSVLLFGLRTTKLKKTFQYFIMLLNESAVG